MGLNIDKPRRRSAERPNVWQRVAAAAGLAGLVLTWAVMLIPCALWLGFCLITKRPAAGRAMMGRIFGSSLGRAG